MLRPFVPLWLVALGLATGCGEGPADPAPPPSDALAYVVDQGLRRATLESQLVSTANAYAFERLRSYALDDGWDALPIEPLADIPAWPDTQVPPEESEFLALGRRAFFEYPARVGAEFAPGLAPGMDMPHAREAEDGTGRAVITCATCHAGPAGGPDAIGAPNTALNIGAIYAQAFDAPDSPELSSWGPGRMDVTADTADDPVRIIDLRPLRHQRLLQAAGAIRQRHPTDLAIRLETLLITASGRRTRPARATIAALAWWLHTLSPPAPQAPPPKVFQERCARCHDPATGYASSDPIPAADVATDPTAAWSPGRGTGGYKAPSLIGVTQRSPLLHDASIPTLDALLDPARTRGGHTFTAALAPAQLTHLKTFLTSLTSRTSRTSATPGQLPTL